MDCTEAAIPTPASPTNAPAGHTARLCVLGSGSRGNCSVLHTVDPDGTSSVTLIDLGFSPRMTARMLAEAGLSLEAVDAVLLTHLDHDHCHLGWNAPDALPRSAQVFLHEGHLQRAYSRGLNGGRLQPFHGQRGKPGEAFSTSDRRHLAVRPLMTFHDDLGAAVFHITIGNAVDAPAIGYATDLGRVTDELITHLRSDVIGGASSGRSGGGGGGGEGSISS
ncbi:MAG: MBL fold metallo-hydrolase [Phycisphaerales bacterium]